MAVALDARTDDDLLALLQAGDDVAFQALVDRHRPWLVRFCTRLLGHDAHSAEDVAQESLLKLHAAARQGRPLRVRPWLTVVARNTCVDEQRRRRPELPGELPERAVAGDDPGLDAALAEAWSRLSGRHREVLYLREVLGFSYKEIGAVMGLSMPATETLVFRARAALRREYERSGGSSFGCLLLGLQLARLGGERRRDAAVADRLTGMALADPGLGGVTSRLTQFLSTSLPGCGEQAIAKVLSVAAGVAMAAASMTAGIGPFADSPSASAHSAAAAAAGAPSPVPVTGDSGAVVAPVTEIASAPVRNEPPAGGSWKTLLGDAVPAGWSPQRSGAAAATVTSSARAAGEAEASRPRPTPLRDAVESARSSDRPQLRPERDQAEPGPLRSILPVPAGGERAERPRPIRTVLEDPIPLALDALPLEAAPLELPSLSPEPPAEAPTGERPAIRETVQPLVATFAGDDGTPLRLRDREIPREGLPPA
ncbi:MAG TPA: sigma-70 family RNA polymerase sigma factor [Acidimicrobiia bacterium]|nr:sigma-70 family RNA polymerase sigma factor [Acidimicrobiia bacterium]